METVNVIAKCPKCDSNIIARASIYRFCKVCNKWFCSKCGDVLDKLCDECFNK